MSDLESATLLVIGVAMLVGALVQTTVGLGLGLVAAPVVTLVAPQLMPGTLLLTVSILPLMTLARERQDIDWGGLGWSLPTRVLGTAVGVLLVASLTVSELGALVGAMVLLAVLLTAGAVVVPVTRGTLASAGFISGITGTTSSIGGPPMALLLQHRPPRQLRSTLAVYFLIGAAMSLVGLAVAGQMTLLQVQVAAAMAPALLVGAEFSRLLRTRLHPEVVRPLVLVVCSAAAVVLLARSLLG